MCLAPKIRAKGTMLFNAPMAKKARHGALRRSGLTMLRAIAASATRQNTTVKGVKASSATLAKKNEPPHNTESESSQNHTRAGIAP